MTNQWTGFFIKNTEPSIFDFSEDEVSTVEHFSAVVNSEWINADHPLDVIEEYTTFTGRMTPPPEWVHRGAIVALARPLG